MTLPTKLYHYSPRVIDALTNDFYELYKHHWPEEGSMKPCGLWLSVEDEADGYSWFEWCKSEEFRLENLKYRYPVKLADDARILHLSCPESIYAFSIQYAANDPFDFSRRSLFMSQTTYVYMISWKKVKEKYDGIIISPYQWSCRLDGRCNWYYPWDCSSGCIWALDKVTLGDYTIIDTSQLGKEESEGSEAVEKAMDSLPEALALLESAVLQRCKE